MATVRSVISMLSLLPKGRPLEFYDRLGMAAEARLPVPDRSGSERYPSAEWGAALARLEERYGRRVSQILGEPALREIEEEVRRRAEEIPGGGPFDPAFNADTLLARCCYLLCRLISPGVILETGVAYGTTSAFLLRSLQMNHRGALHSVDFIDTTQPHARRAVGVLVPAELRATWNLSFGASRRLLPGLLKRMGQVDLFIHDSAHTYWNMRREFDVVWPYLAPGGILIADDIQDNPAFAELRARDPALWLIVQEADKPSVSFGIAVK
jgi:predicted O-methyltransferase YrrM